MAYANDKSPAVAMVGGYRVAAQWLDADNDTTTRTWPSHGTGYTCMNHQGSSPLPRTGPAPDDASVSAVMGCRSSVASSFVSLPVVVQLSVDQPPPRMWEGCSRLAPSLITRSTCSFPSPHSRRRAGGNKRVVNVSTWSSGLCPVHCRGRKHLLLLSGPPDAKIP
jgi:hypothetical protein